MTSSPLEVFDTPQTLYAEAAESFTRLVRDSADRRITIALAGGSTPQRLYAMLAERDLPWDRIHWFWGDERNVLPEDSDSNYRMVREALLTKIACPADNIHPVPVDTSNPTQAAHRYEQTLREFFPGDPFPRWDLCLLGMGDDAHTASLFPKTPALEETERWFVANPVAKFDGYRYTLTPPAINSARQCWFLVTGSAKRDALSRVHSAKRDPAKYPSQLISAARWLVTEDTAPI